MRGPLRVVYFVVVGSLMLGRQALAWGPDGHQTVAAIAAGRIKGTNAENKVKEILGTVSLAEAAVWADCVKGVDPNNLTYEEGRFAECKAHETPAGETSMIDFVKRNTTSCNPKPGEEICHKQYHYCDIASQHDHYEPTFQGARTDDIVAAIAAAAHVLKGDAAPAPFRYNDKKEALLLLVHYLGDIHQPLHVGAVYLNAKGKRVNPDVGVFDPTTETRGGNQIEVRGTSMNLHATWDAVPRSLIPSKVNAAWLARAKAVAATSGPIFAWPTAWATDTQKQAVQAYKPLTFSKRTDKVWRTTLPDDYPTSMNVIKKSQLTKAGARLAQLLATIWP